MIPVRHRGLCLSLALALLCAQSLLAWHLPSHIDVHDHGPDHELLALADCQVCTHGHGLLALPASHVMPVAQRIEPAVQPRLTPLLQYRERLQPFPRGPPASA